VNLALLCPSADVVLVSAAPLDPQFPGGFAPRHASFASVVAQHHRTELIYVHDGENAGFVDLPQPSGLANVHVVDGSGASGWDDPRLPRQSVARRIRWSGAGKGPLVIPLTASVAHIALTGARSIAVLEEGWERLLRPPGRSARQRVLNVAERLRYQSVYGRVGKSACRIVAISPGEREHLANFMPDDKIRVITFGVDTDYFSPFSVPERTVDVLIIGALNRAEQRVEDLVGLLRRQPETRYARCAVVGPSARPSIRSLAGDTVEVTGQVPDVRPYYARAKVVVIPTFTAVGIKTTMLQAWAMERPVVTSRTVLEVSGHGAFQAHLAVDTVEAMGPVIARLLGDAEERDRLGRSARLVVLQHHEQRRSAQEFGVLVDEVLTETRRL